MMSSASSGSSFQTERHVCGRDANGSAALELDDLVVQLELELPRRDEVDLLLLLVAMTVRALAARVLRHPPVRERDLLGLEVARHHPHLARVVAEDVLDLVEPLDRVVGHRRLLLSRVARDSNARNATARNASATTPYVLPTNSGAPPSFQQVRVGGGAPTTPAFELSLEDQRVVGWRFDQFRLLGYGDEDAWLLVDSGADLQLPASLIGAGCPLHLALRIVV